MDMDHFLKYFLWKLILMRFSLKKKKLWSINLVNYASVGLKVVAF